MKRTMNIDPLDILKRVIAVFFPERCVLCGEVVAYDDICCNKCVYKKCGEIDCGHFSHKFISAAAGAEYEGNVRKALLRVKDKPDNRALLFFAGLMLETIGAGWPRIKFDLIVPVPINESRLKNRGFNQAEELASRLSGLTGVPMRADVLLRHEDSLVQHTLKKDERRENAAKSYDIANAGDIPDKTVLLVDDVFTTGATLSACSDKLLAAGAREVYVIAATAVTRPQSA